MIELNDLSFEHEVTQASGPVLVDFYAPWCGPCKMLAPLLDKLAGEYAGRVQFAKVNVDDAQGLASRFHITGVPTLVLFHGPLVLDTFVGVPSVPDLKASLDKSSRPGMAAGEAVLN